MNRSFQFLNADSLPKPDDCELSSSEECDDQFYKVGNGLERMESPANLNRDISESLSVSTPCMSDSRPTSSIDTGCDWDDSLLRNVATSDSCLVSTAGSSSAASPLMRISSPGMSPSAENKMSFSYSFGCTDDRETSLASLNDALRTERDFIDFVMSSFPLGEKPSYTFPEGKKSANDSNPKVGLDHLDNLCKLMEQLSDLKEANVRLKRRVQYLEDVKTLHEIHKEMTAEPKLSNSGPSEDDDRTISSKKSSPLDLADGPREETVHDDVTEIPHCLYRSNTSTNISKTQEVKRGGLHKSRTISSVSQDRLRERSKSVGHTGSHSKTKKRISRWSKVKEALGIDKADNECDDISRPCEQRNEGLMSNVTNGNMADHQQLRGEVKVETKTINSTKNLNERSSTRNRSSGLSSHSFSKFYREALEVKPEKKSGTLDCPQSAQRSLAEYEKEDSFKKSPKSPWCKMKNIIQIRRDNRHHKGESRSSSSTSRNAKALKSEDHQDSDHQCSCTHQRRSSKSRRDSIIKESRRSNHDICSGNSGREKLCETTEGTFRDNAAPLRQKPSTTKRSQFKEQSNEDDSCSKQNNDKSLQPTKDQIRAQTHTEKQERHSSSSKVHHSAIPASKENGKRKKPKPRPLNLHGDTNNVHCENVQSTEDDRDTPKTPGSSPQIHRKWVWTRVKDVLRGKRDDGARLSISVPSSPSSSADVVAFNFQPVEGEALAEDPISLPYSKADLPSEMRETDILENPTMSDLLQELQRNLSDDFNKKLDEWQRLRSAGVRIPNLSVERKDSFGRLKKISVFDKKFTTGEKATKQTNNIQKKDISWLEKELHKVEREILRLSKEKQKFEKRAFRLKRLKDAMTDTHQKKEVLVRTSAGEFRFEGISDAFTKKLYEWETKNGVLPELSTIALLDECLQNKHKKFPDSLKADILSATTERGGLSSQSSRSSLSPDSTIKTCFQASRASSEPDLSSLSAQKEGCMQTRSKSGDTLISTSQNEKSADGLLTSPMEDNDQWTPKARDTVQTEDSYYCLLEENMFLLDQLKSKEELCRQLQNELHRIDNKSDKTNKTHEEEMEKYRMKLWEIHMSRPRDLQGSLHLISELKKRIEELQKCSDKLKLDRQSLEESFRFHSEQQSQLTRDLIEKLRDLQEAGQLGFFHRSGCRRRCRKQVKCDFASVSRIHYLTTMLLEQGREMELALMERTRQVCHLRWELLQRDMSAVLLQAALHRVNCQGDPTAHVAAWNKKRNKFKTHKSWTIDATARCQSQECVAEPWSQERLRQVSVTPFTDWATVEFNPNDMMSTVHELKKEALKMSCFRLDRFSEAEDTASKTANGSAESEMADSDRLYDTGSAVNSRSSSFSSGPGGLRGSHSDTRLYEKSRDFCRRRNSSSSMSCLSGMDASDSSSIHDSDRMRFLMRRRPWTRWRSRDNVSTPCSSQSSVMEDEMNSCKWDQPVDADEYEDRPVQNQLQLRYGSLNENDEPGDRSEEKLNSFVERGSQCLITPRPIHLVLNAADCGESEDSSSQTFSSKMLSTPNTLKMDSLSRYSQDRSVDRSLSSEVTTVYLPEDQNCTLSTQTDNSYSILDEDVAYSDSLLVFNDTDDERVRHEDLYYSSENSEMAYLKRSSLSSQMMDSEKTEFSSILYPSLNPSPYNSGDDMGYAFSKQHTNTDESNTSPEHSEMEVLNITHPVHDFLLYSSYPPIQTIHEIESHAYITESHPASNMFRYQYPVTFPNGKTKDENFGSQYNESVTQNINSVHTSHISSNNTNGEDTKVPERICILQNQIINNATEDPNGQISQNNLQDKENSSTAHNTSDPRLLYTAPSTSDNMQECSTSTISTGKPQNIAQIKYKGTKGFGKCTTKWEFRREAERNQTQNHATSFSLSINENATNHITQPSTESNGT